MYMKNKQNKQAKTFLRSSRGATRSALSLGALS